MNHVHDGILQLVNCDNCNREFKKRPGKLTQDKQDYCCLDCRYYHMRFNERCQKDRTYRKLKIFALRRLEIMQVQKEMRL
jgi:transposase-like protein